MAAFRQGRAAGVTAPMFDDPDAIYFPEAEIMPSLAMAFMRMMFAHAEFEEQVRRLQAAIVATPARRPHAFLRLLRLLNFGRNTGGGGLGNSRIRPKRMAKLIKDRPGLVKDQEATQIVQILKAAIGSCDRRNVLAHGRWWRFDTKTSTIKIRGERSGESQWADYTEAKILAIHGELRALAAELYKLRRDIEHRRGDHDIHESDVET
jgi:hypothetical protein